MKNKALKNPAVFLGLPYAVWAAVFVVVPLIMVIWYGLTDDSGAFTLANIAAIAAPPHIKSLLLSVAISLAATVVCLLLAYPLCMILASTEKKADSFLVMLLIVPMWMNFMLRTYAWQSILEKTGLINTFLGMLSLPKMRLINTPGAIILGMVYDFLPFMVLPIYNSLSHIDKNLYHAAADLFAGRWKTFTKITLPLSLPGVLSGITMVFVPALTTFVISSLLGGGKILLIGNVIEQEFTQAYDWHLGSGLSIVLLIFIIINAALQIASDRSQGKEDKA